jgi:hypothetical protein
MVAFIEYDVTLFDRQNASAIKTEPPLPPFSVQADICSLTAYPGAQGVNTGSKNYPFFGAVAGVRNTSGKEPLFPPRGLPSLLSEQMEWAIKRDGVLYEDDLGLSWLTLGEIKAALAHHEVGEDRMAPEILAILDAMEALEKRFGVNRVRLVFAFE